MDECFIRFMRMKMRSIILFLFLFLVNEGFSQTRIGAWRDHLPYHSCKKVVKVGNLVYCATDNNIFTYNTKDNSLQKLSKITGLSDIGVANMEYSAENDISFIAYTDGNIDLVKNQTITNIPDIYKQSVPGSKKANHIFFQKNFAYVSYSFGIVVIDLTKKEIKDTYQVGEAGTAYEVFATVADDNYFYAATQKGIFKGGINDPFLVNYQRWQRDNTIPNSSGKFNTLGVFNGKIISNFNGSADKTDTLYYLDNAGWKYLPVADHQNHFEIRASGNQLLVTGAYHVYTVSANLQVMQTITDYGFAGADPRSTWLDETGNLWIADGGNGLVVKSGGSGFQSIYPNGPNSVNVGKMQFMNGTLYVSGGGTTTGMAPLYFHGELFQFANENWTSAYNQNAFDYTAIAVDPTNPKSVFVGSWGNGVYVYNEGQVSEHYTDQNSTLRTNIPGIASFCIGGVAIDADKNLWVTQGGVSAPVSVRKPDGKSWVSLSWNAYLGTYALGEIHIDQNNQFWIPLLPNHGMFVFDPNGTIENDKDDKIIIFKPTSAYNETIDRVVCAASDKDGYVWVGTDHGPVYYQNPKDVFNGETAGTKVLIPRNDGKNTVDPLLGTETVNCIAVDGANRKWFGTEKGGAYLVSPDGTREIHHFNMTNSPLFSNNILSIAINGSTGEVFFGTDKGIISYRANASTPDDDFNNVYVFPNPVRENYEGIVTIKGLIENTIVKITDISGNLVYQTKSLGAEATWDGRGHNGRKAATGVYLVFCSNEDGSKTYVTKMLIIH